ncbi:hypothetical protein [Paractinoplanes toevensis]|uniref:Uncharacterized protein n=1 Tax=Paractinoplanes toevensis TaxID=571911 RepID=A0A919W501_9ACTN|nr:hypothetical protein [Actinoplanes toevensis]GIM90708.1 hypothetical protein Ato02nite_025010 [Actinoplanes toevensis]
MRDRFTELDYGLSLLSLMYHQDWRSSGDWTAVLEIFLWEDQTPPAVLALYEDAAAFSSLSRVEIEDVWTASTDENFIFGRDADSGDDFLSVIQERSRTWLVARGIPTPSAGVPIPKRAPAEAVGAQIGSLMAWSDVDGRLVGTFSVLKRFAETSSPDLAFRLFLRIVDARRMEISSQLYHEFVLLGRSLNFGDFVVSSLEYLVSDTNG